MQIINTEYLKALAPEKNKNEQSNDTKVQDNASPPLKSISAEPSNNDIGPSKQQWGKESSLNVNVNAENEKSRNNLVEDNVSTEQFQVQTDYQKRL